MLCLVVLEATDRTFSGTSKVGGDYNNVIEPFQCPGKTNVVNIND